MARLTRQPAPHTGTTVVTPKAPVTQHTSTVSIAPRVRTALRRRVTLPRWFYPVLALATVVTLIDVGFSARALTYGPAPSVVLSWKPGYNYGLISPDGKYILKSKQVREKKHPSDVYLSDMWNLTLINKENQKVVWTRVVDGIGKEIFSPDGSLIFLEGRLGQILDIKNGSTVWNAPQNAFPIHFNASGSHAFWIDAVTGKTKIWNIVQNKKQAEFSIEVPIKIYISNNGRDVNAQLSNDGSLLCADVPSNFAVRKLSSSLLMRDINRGKSQIFSKIGVYDPQNFSPDNKFVLISKAGSLVVSESAVECLDPTFGVPLWKIFGSSLLGSIPYDTAWSHDSRFVAIATADTVTLFTGKTGKQLYQFRRTRNVTSSRLEFSSDGRTLSEVVGTIQENRNAFQTEETLQTWDLSRVLPK